ncbi:MAG: hypothetical protein ABEJ28_01020 [Salinigranum sp.]
MERNAVAVCQECDDAVPVVVSEDGTVDPLRPGESCKCGAERFRLVDLAEVDDVTGGEAEPHGDAHPA